MRRYMQKLRKVGFEWSSVPSRLVILNNHNSDSGWCCSLDDGNGLWYTDSYDEAAWLEHVSFMAKRYQENERVVGFDLRNELRDATVNGESRSVTWFSGAPLTDWAPAALKGGEAVVAANSHMLVIVEGLNYAVTLEEVQKFPVHARLSAPNRVTEERLQESM